MLRRGVGWVGAASCLAVASAAAGPPVASTLTAGTPKAGRAPAAASSSATGVAPSRRAALLASHGEVELAWAALRSAGPARTDADARLAVRLLTELRRYSQADSLLAREAARRANAPRFSITSSAAV
jgi:hypothetical protein